MPASASDGRRCQAATPDTGLTLATSLWKGRPLGGSFCFLPPTNSPKREGPGLTPLLRRQEVQDPFGVLDTLPYNSPADLSVALQCKGAKAR